ncbi:MAG: NPCBM/NEW2 domain-containing protein [Oscillospiraceae bacterium]|jgi:hypothetical protein|nr:NPCBM/NEW2 domain-containing protein [Oscillospiraceae bacterium]
MRKRILAALLAVAVAMPAFVFAPAAYGAAPAGAETVSSPDGAVVASFWLDNGTPYYNVVQNGFEVVEPSRLGINTSLGGLSDGFTGYTTAANTGDTTWKPVVGERETIVDRWNGKTFTLEKGDLRLGVELRAYDQGGAALRYILPEGAGYNVTGEETRFTFPSGGTAYMHNNTNQTGQTIRAVTSLGSGTFRRPMTVLYPNGKAITIAEANLDNYAVMNLSPNGTRAVKAGLYSNVAVTEAGPNVSPWRVIVCADSLTELPKNADIIPNLNEAPDEAAYGFSQWVKPGSAVRATGLNNAFIKNVIDMCAANGHKYVLLDAGWYGQESTLTNDPRLDPAALDMNVASDVAYRNLLGKSGEGYNGTGEGVYRNGSVDVDVPALCQYAKERGVGIILYVNGVFFPDDGSGRYRFTADELFAYYEKWGVKGVKPGFVDVNSQKNEANNQYIIEAAARHHLIMTIHDEYVTTGTERTFPNCLTVEGIKGDEESSLEVSDDLSFAFTRTIQGPADHTYCYVGKATKAYALASPIVFKSGLHLLYWYTNPDTIPAGDAGKHGFWESLPATWKESLYLEARIREYVTCARKSFDDVWYVASLSAVTRELSLPLTFLDAGVAYKAEIFADGADADPSGGRQTGAAGSKAGQTLEYTTVLVNRDMTLTRSLKYGFGYAVKLTPATADEIAGLPVYRPDIARLRTLIDFIPSLTESAYTEASWNVLAGALDAANRVLDVPQITETVPGAAAVEAAYGALRAAVDGLSDVRALQKALTRTSYLVREHYTEDSWSALAAAAATGNGLLTGLGTQAEIDAAANAIDGAIAALVTHPNRRPQSVVYLSDDALQLSPGSITHDGAGESGIRRDIRRDRGGKIQLMVDGAVRTFDKGVSAHAKVQPGIATLIYDIGAYGFHWFQSYLGVDYAKPSGGNVKFRIYGDGVLMYESAETGNGSQNAQFVSLPINGVDILTIEIDELGSNDSDWADLADAKFLVYHLVNLDYAALDAAIAAAESLADWQYSASSWADLEQALAAARALYDDPETMQADVDAAAAAVKGACDNLAPVAVSTVYLSDLTHTSSGMTVHNDKNRAGNAGLQVTVDGQSKTFDKGVAIDGNANGWAIYDIEGRGFRRFQAYVCIDRRQTNTGADAKFHVYLDYGDGSFAEVYTSAASGPSSRESQRVSVDVAGAVRIRIWSDPLSSPNYDWADWADAKFLAWTSPDDTICGLTVDGLVLPEFKTDNHSYYYPAAGGAVPVVSAQLESDAASFEVFPAQEVPGVTVVAVTDGAGAKSYYYVNFRRFGQPYERYASDMAAASMNWYDVIYSDISVRYGMPMSVTAADGVSELTFDKGIGGHAKAGASEAVYEVEGMGFTRFQAYVGIPFWTAVVENDGTPLYNGGAATNKDKGCRSSVTFRVYVDDETTARFTSPVMGGRTPAQFVDVDITGAKRVRLSLDGGSSNAADHANWADAKFIGEALYLSDLPAARLVSNTAYGNYAVKDSSVSGAMMVTLDGTTAAVFAKGVGSHASASGSSSLVYNIAGLGYDRFETYVGISWQKHLDELAGLSGGTAGKSRSSVNFRIFIDDEVKPRFESGVMYGSTPAKFASVDIRGASTLRIQLDAGGDQSADHANLADAKFVVFERGVVARPFFEQESDGLKAKYAVVNDTTVPASVYRILASYEDGRLAAVERAAVSVGKQTYVQPEAPIAETAERNYGAFVWDKDNVPLVSAANR